MSPKIKLICLCLAALLALLVFTDPTQLPVPVLIVPFILFFVILVLLFQMALNRLGRASSNNLRTALFLASLPTILLALQSVGQLTVKDVLMICGLFLIGYLYLHRSLGATN